MAVAAVGFRDRRQEAGGDQHGHTQEQVVTGHGSRACWWLLALPPPHAYVSFVDIRYNYKVQSTRGVGPVEITFLISPCALAG